MYSSIKNVKKRQNVDEQTSTQMSFQFGKWLQRLQLHHSDQVVIQIYMKSERN